MSMTFAVTGVTGPFGRLTTRHLLERGTNPRELVGLARTPDRAAEVARLGVTVRHFDFDQPDTLDPALEGIDVLLLVSGSEIGRRIPQHQAVIDAAKNAGVQRIAYTSILGAPDSPLSLAPEHRVTEQYIRDSGVPYVFLRNSSYYENFLANLDQYLATGEVVGATRNTPIAGAARTEMAEAAAVALLNPDAKNVVYEIAGPKFTHAELAAAITDATGQPVKQREVTVAEYRQLLLGAGLDEATAGFVAGLDDEIARGGWDSDSRDLAELLGRDPLTLQQALCAHLNKN